MANLVNYIKKIWKDAPSTDTPINAENLNHMEDGIYNNATAINTLNSDLTHTKATTGIDTTGSIVSNLDYIREQMGELCVLTVDFSGTNISTNDWKLIGTLPTGYRPDVVVKFGWSDILGHSGIGRIKTDGAIEFVTQNATVTDGSFVATFFVTK